MKILLKYIIENFKEKLGRTLLLILSIALSTALLISTLNSSETMINLFEKQFIKVYGTYNVKIEKESTNEYPFIDKLPDSTIKYNSRINLASIPSALSKDKNVKINILGINRLDLYKLPNFKLLNKASDFKFSEENIIISKKFSDETSKKVGDNVRVKVNDSYLSFKITAIAENTGLLSSEADDNFIFIVPITKLYSLPEYQGGNNQILLDIDQASTDQFIRDFNKENLYKNNLFALKTIDDDAIQNQVSSFSVPLYFMTILSVIMSAFILFNSFQLIISERLASIGTIMSVGATLKNIKFLFLIEVILYTFVGIILGLIASLGVSYKILQISNPGVVVGYQDLQFTNFNNLFITLIIITLVSLFSSILPLQTLNKYPPKDIILNQLTSSSSYSLVRKILFFLVIILTVIIIYYSNKIDERYSLLGVGLLFLTVIIGLPFIVMGLTRIFGKIIYPLNNIFFLAFNNLNGHKLLHNNIILLVIIQLSGVITLSISNSIRYDINSAFQNMNYDFKITSSSDISNKDLNILEKEGLKNVYYISNLSLNLKNDTSNNLITVAVDPSEYKTFENYMLFENKIRQLKELDESDNGIIISKFIAKNNNIDEGDAIIVRGNGKTVRLRVLSLVDAKQFSAGNYNIISNKTAKDYFGIEKPNSAFIRTENNSQSEVIKNLKEKLTNGFDYTFITKSSEIKMQEEEISRLTNVLDFIVIFMSAIGVISIFSNMTIALMQRTHELAILNSLGMTKSQVAIMMIVESVLQCIIATGLTIILTPLIINLFNGVLKGMDFNMEFIYPSEITSHMFITTLFITLLPWLLFQRKVRKLDVVKEIKYE